MFLDEANKSKLCEVASRHRLIHVRGSCIPPGASAIIGGESGSFGVDTPADQFLDPCAWPFPLSPKDTAEFPSQPPIQFLKTRLYLRQAEIIQPSPHKRYGGLNQRAEVPTASPVEACTQLILEPFDRFWSYAQLGDAM